MGVSMKVVCDRCESTYKVPNAKLTKPVNKATCRNCNARLLIPQARPGAAEDERVVVTAVVQRPTNEHQVASKQDDDKTVPMADPKIASKADADDVPLVSGERIGAKDKALLKSSPRRSATPKPASSKPEASPAAPSDMAWLKVVFALAGVTVAGSMFGAVIPIFDNPILEAGRSFVVISSGLAIMLLMLTSEWGRQRPPASVAVLLATMMGAIIAGALGVATAVIEAPEGRLLALQIEPAKNIEPAEETKADATEEVVAKAETPKEAAKVAATVRSKPKAAPKRTTTSSRRAKPAAQPTAAPAPDPAPAPTPVAISRPAPVEDDFDAGLEDLDAMEEDDKPKRKKDNKVDAVASTTSDAAPTSVPFTVIDIQIRNSVDVKRCFFQLQRSGAPMPARLDTTFSLSGSGRASGLKVRGSDLGGTEFERCLDRAVSGITFPESSGGTQRIDYPFKLAG